MADLLNFAHGLADAAAAITVPLFRAGAAVDNKLDTGFDPVTQADRDAERAMRARIENHFPTHGILGEEFGEKPGSGDHQWVLDPIDGTRAFISGMPIWGTLIGLADAQGPALGIMDQPYIGERFAAARGAGAYWQKGAARQRITTRPCTQIEEAIIATSSPDYFQNTPAAPVWEALYTRARLGRYGGDCYHYAMLAAGHIDIVIEQGLQPYDILALIPIIEEAGGVVTDWRGQSAAQGGQVIASASPELHAATLEALAPAAW